MTGGKFDIDDLQRRMNGSVDALNHEFAGLRTGRANVALLDAVMVDAYGAMMPINQVGTVAVPEPRMITGQVWDKGLVGPVEKAIQNADLGLNPFADGQMVRIPIPELNEERRQEMTRIAGKYAEQSRVAARNVRRDGMDKLKHAEKDGDMSQDKHRDLSDDVQKMTDDAVSRIDDLLAKKEHDIMEV